MRAAVVDAGVKEIVRWQSEQQEKNPRGRGGRGGRTQRFDVRDLQRNEDLRDVFEDLNEFWYKRYDYGFHIEDPDIDEIRDRKPAAGP